MADNLGVADNSGANLDLSKIDDSNLIDQEKSRPDLFKQPPNRVTITRDEVLEELKLMLHSSVADYYIDDKGQIKVVDGEDPRKIRCIKSVKKTERKHVERLDGRFVPIITTTWEFTLWPKERAIELGLRYLGLLVDRLRVEDPRRVLADMLGAPLDSIPDARSYLTGQFVKRIEGQ